MAVQIVSRAPRARCYQCGTTDLAGVCHHCGRPMCSNHTPKSTDLTGGLSTIEFADLGLKGTRCGEAPVHCEQCAHTVLAPSFTPIVLGGLIGLAGLALLASGSVFGLAGLLLGGGLAAYGYVTNQRRLEEAIRSRPPVPVLPRFGRPSVQERIRGSIALDSAGVYRSTGSPPEGVLAVAASLGEPERRTLELYRKRHRLPETEDLPFNAGFAVLRGAAGLRLLDGAAGEIRGTNVLPLTGRVSAHPVLNGSAGGSREWRATRRYGVSKAAGDTSLPIRLVPSFVQEVGRRVLDLELQWAAPDPEGPQLEIQRIERLELLVPSAWGNVESVRDGALVARPEAGRDGEAATRRITWQQLPVRTEERRQRRRTFFVQFENGIDSAATLRGRVEVAFKGTVSGVEGVALHYPLGGRLGDVPAEVETRVTADFELSLAGLRHQELRVVPDPRGQAEPERSGAAAGTATFEGVVPDHATVMALTGALAAEGFYVKRVIENPPRTGEHASVVNRYWDLAGRHYLGVYPIDWHLIVAGEATYGGESRALAGTTETTVTVQCVYANADMEQQIENVWERLAGLIDDTLGKLPRAVPPSTAPPLVVALQPEPSRAESTGDRAERIAELRRRLDHLAEALAAGRLLERAYLDLKSSLEQELQALQDGARV